jgi:DNA-binding SARP family transcriptional activator
MQFRILGPLEVAEGDCLISLAGTKRSLPGLLLLSANEVVSADRLIEER